jgi:hypothetical protein
MNSFTGFGFDSVQDIEPELPTRLKEVFENG